MLSNSCNSITSYAKVTFCWPHYGHPLQDSFLENSGDGGAWWAAVHGVAESDTTEATWWRRLWRRQWHPTPVLLPGESQGQESLVGCSPRGRWELDTTERLHFQFSLSCIGEGTGTPIQCSCLENPRDGWAWWAAVYGAAQSRTRLKRLSGGGSTMSTAQQ